MSRRIEVLTMPLRQEDEFWYASCVSFILCVVRPPLFYCVADVKNGVPTTSLAVT